MGATIFLMISGYSPYGIQKNILGKGSDKRMELNAKYKTTLTLTESIWNNYPGLADFLPHLLTANDDERYGWPQIFRHRYIRELFGEEVYQYTDFRKLKILNYKNN